MAIVKVTYNDGEIETFDDSRDYGHNEVRIHENVILIKEYTGHEVIIPITSIKRIDHFRRNL